MTTPHLPVDDDASLPPDPFPGDPFAPAPKRRWYKRPVVVLAAAVVVIIAASVVVDIPHPATSQVQATEYATLLRSVDTGIKTCTFGIKETLTIYERARQGTLTASDRKQIPNLVIQDEQACTFVNQSLVNIPTLTIPPGPARAPIAAMITSTLQWTTSDAARVITSVDTLLSDPTDQKAHAELLRAEHDLEADRLAANAHVREASRVLHGAYIPYPTLPVIPITQ